MTTAEFERRARKLMDELAAGNLNGLATAPGMCQQFAGRFFTLVTGEHYLRDGQAGSAWAAYQEMLQTDRGEELSKGDKLQPGDVLFWRGGDYGHVAIHVGGGRIIENTTSGRGQKVGPKTGNIRSGLTIRAGYHAMRLPWITPAYVGEPRVVVEPMQGRPRVVLETIERDDVLYVPARAAFEAVGLAVHADKLKDHGKVYVKEAQG